MAYTNIDLPTDYFNTVLWTGNNSSPRNITTGHATDLVWVKFRSSAFNHRLFDNVRGGSKKLISNNTDAEDTGATNDVTAFISTGFTIGANINNSADGTVVGWSWKANGTGSSNTSGTITSTVSANTTSGFSIVSYTGNGATAASIGHGLNVTPAMMIVKKRSATHEWCIWHKSLSSATQSYLQFDTLAAQTSVNVWGNTAPTSSLFYVGPASVTNGSSATFIAYCFAEIKGYSRFGSYTGNGSADGTFVYTGFKPAFVIVKRYNDAGYDWLMYDNKRQVEFNVVDDFLKPNLSDAETTGNANQSLDFLSNGIKFRGSGASSNGSGSTYIYMAFAENPFVSSTGIPTTAR